MKKQKGWKRALVVILCVILALILIGIIFASVYVNHLLNQMNRVEPGKESTMSPSQVQDMEMTDPDLETVDPSGGETFIPIENITFPTEPPAPDPTDPAPTEPVIYGDHLVNILLVGQDRREGQGRQRSDSMILVSFNQSKGTITLTSFMRDQYVQIPGYRSNKLNAAYQYGGMSLLSETLRVNFGVLVDGVVEVDFSGFEKVINLLGGVDVNMTQAECDYFNTFTDWELKPGMNHLDGYQALCFSRLREIDTDYRRAERQRAVLTALMEAYKNQPMDQMLRTLEQILPMITTNMSNAEILGHAVDLFPMLAGSTVNTLRIPLEGTFHQGYVEVRPGYTNWFQYHIDFEANRQRLYEVFAPAN